MTCYNLERIPPTLDELCMWKTAKHTDILTKENTKEFTMCVTCNGYEKTKDCYYSHKEMDEYLITTK